jgi:hypothetical protein
MSEKVSPYYGNLYSDKKITVKKMLGEVRVTGNDKVSPAKLLKWLCGLDTNGWSNLQVDTRHEEGDDNNLPDDYITVEGDRLETDKEFKERQEWILNSWRRKYVEYLDAEKFFASNPVGLAQLEELRKHKKIK